MSCQSSVPTNPSEDQQDFVCALSAQLLEDPVSVVDEPRFTYERRFIQKWFDECRSRNRPITSPMTRKEISECLVQNKSIKTRMLNQWHHAAFKTPQTKSILVMREIFDKLESLRDILSATLHSWQPPQIIVLGQEGTGKSSVLERLAMMPLFPRAEGICTRVPIHLRLRNAEQAQAPMLQVYNTRTKATEEGPYMIPLQWGALEVSEKMDEILRKEHGRCNGVSSDRIIIVQVEGPMVPSLDLVDMPGLVAAPQDLAVKTQSLVEEHVKQHGAHSMYLVVVPAAENPRNSAAMTLIERLGLQDNTLGVATMCDEVTDRRLPALRRQLGLDPQPAAAEVGDCITLKEHGWVATVNKATEGADTGAQRLRAQAAEEEGLLEAKLPGAVLVGRASCGALVDRLNGMFLQYMRRTWVPRTLSELEAAVLGIQEEEGQLGLPAITCAEEGRGLACREAARIVAEQGSAIDDHCCTEVLEPLRLRLRGLVRSKVEGVAMSSLRELWRSERRELEAVCREAAHQWAARWAGKLKCALAGAAEDNLSERRKRKAEGSAAAACFRLDRFPRFIAAVVERSAELLEEAAAAILADASVCADLFYSCVSPNVRVKAKLAERPSELYVERDVEALVANVLLAFHLSGSVARPLTDSLERVASGVEDWVEACAAERGLLQRKLEQLRAAQDGIRKLLGGSQVLLKGHSKAVHSVDWSPDGRLLATAGEDGTFRLWDAVSAVQIVQLQDCVPSYIRKVAFSPDGRLLATCGIRSVKVWEVLSYSLAFTLDDEIVQRESLAWRADGKQLACGRGSGAVHVWSLAPGLGTPTAATVALEGHTGTVYHVKYHPLGKWIASAGGDKTIRVWDAEAMVPVASLEGHRFKMLGLAWSPDGLLLASLSYDDGVRLWDSVTWELQTVLKCAANFNDSGLAFSPDGRLLAAASKKTVRLFDMDRREEAAVLEEHNDNVTDLAFSPCGTLLARATMGSSVLFTAVPACFNSDQSRPAGAAGSKSAAADGSVVARSVRRRRRVEPAPG